jgi:predicted nucleic acid-binding protein
MRADYRVVLDACVLIPMPLADTLLRMAEAPRLYLPKWPRTIMDEVTRNLIAKWDMASEKAHRREEELRLHFPEAWVEGFEPIIGVVTNDPGDRHVLAAAVRSHSELIVTYNRRHFPAASLQPWEIDVQGPSAFLRGLYDLDAGLSVGKLHEQAATIEVSLPRLLHNLAKNVPGFVVYFCEEQGIDLAGEQRGASR